MAEIAAPQPRPLAARASRAWNVAVGTWLIPCALFLLAVAPRVFLVWQSGFDGLYGQDAYAYYDYARQMFTELSRAQPPPPFWWPLGYPTLLNLGFLILGTSVRAAQVITLVSGAAIAPFAYLLAREASGGKGGQVAGLVAGSILALGGQAVQSSVVIMSDAPALMWATLSAWLLLRYRHTHSFAALALSAISTSLAVITRWENLGFALVWIVATLSLNSFLVKEGRGSDARRLKGADRRVAIALGLAALVLLPQLAYKVAYAAPFAGQSWLEGWSPANSFARSFDNVDGHFAYALPVALFYSQVFFHPAYLFPLLTPFLVVGVWVLAKRIRGDPSAFVLLGGWIGVMYLFLAGIPYENFRFGLGFFVPVAVAAGIGIGASWEKLQERIAPPPAPLLRSRRPRGTWAGLRSGSATSEGGEDFQRALRLGFGVLLVLALAGTTLWEPRVLRPVLEEKGAELKAAQWLGGNLPTGAWVWAFGVTEALRMYTGLQVYDLSEETPQRIKADVQANTPAFLFVDVTNIQTQWHGRELEQTFLTLRNEMGLQEVGQTDPWTLFRIGAAP
jgi:hypothetical protein